MESRVEIEVLFRQGKGIREIARITGLSRNTVRDVIRGRSDGQYGPRSPKSAKLDVNRASFIQHRSGPMDIIELISPPMRTERRGRQPSAALPENTFQGRCRERSSWDSPEVLRSCRACAPFARRKSQNSLQEQDSLTCSHRRRPRFETDGCF